MDTIFESEIWTERDSQTKDADLEAIECTGSKCINSLMDDVIEDNICTFSNTHLMHAVFSIITYVCFS